MCEVPNCPIVASYSLMSSCTQEGSWGVLSGQVSCWRRPSIRCVGCRLCARKWAILWSGRVQQLPEHVGVCGCVLPGPAERYNDPSLAIGHLSHRMLDENRRQFADSLGSSTTSSTSSCWLPPLCCWRRQWCLPVAFPPTAYLYAYSNRPIPGLPSVTDKCAARVSGGNLVSW